MTADHCLKVHACVQTMHVNTRVCKYTQLLAVVTHINECVINLAFYMQKYNNLISSPFGQLRANSVIKDVNKSNLRLSCTLAVKLNGD